MKTSQPRYRQHRLPLSQITNPNKNNTLSSSYPITIDLRTSNNTNKHPHDTQNKINKLITHLKCRCGAIQQFKMIINVHIAKIHKLREQRDNWKHRYSQQKNKCGNITNCDELYNMQQVESNKNERSCKYKKKPIKQLIIANNNSNEKYDDNKYTTMNNNNNRQQQPNIFQILTSNQYHTSDGQQQQQQQQLKYNINNNNKQQNFLKINNYNNYNDEQSLLLTSRNQQIKQYIDTNNNNNNQYQLTINKRDNQTTIMKPLNYYQQYQQQQQTNTIIQQFSSSQFIGSTQLILNNKINKYNNNIVSTHKISHSANINNKSNSTKQNIENDRKQKNNDQVLIAFNKLRHRTNNSSHDRNYNKGYNLVSTDKKTANKLKRFQQFVQEKLQMRRMMEKAHNQYKQMKDLVPIGSGYKQNILK